MRFSLMNSLPMRLAHPSLTLLVVRLAIALVFWKSGQTKVDGFALKDTTFLLFAEEYKLPLLPPPLAAYLATISEHLFSILLMLGLCTRFSALALLVMTMVIQLFVYPQSWPIHLQWAGLLMTLMYFGAGNWSLDRWLLARK
jgi:putative oxidoreductase